MGLLDAMIYGYRAIFNSFGVEMTRRSRMKFLNATVTDDAINDLTVINATGGGGGGESNVEVINTGGGQQNDVVTDNGTDPATVLVFTQNDVLIGGLDGGVAGRRLTICTLGTGVTIQHQHGDSAAANRFRCPNSADVIIPPHALYVVAWDSSDSRWHILAQLFLPGANGDVILSDGSQGAQALGDLHFDVANHSFKAGSSCTASAARAISMGDTSTASAVNAIAMGLDDFSTAANAVTLGKSNSSSADSAVSTGRNNSNSGVGGTACGDGNVVTGAGAFAGGAGNYATAQGATSLGNANVCAGLQGVCAGSANTCAAAASYGVAMGFQNQVFYLFAAALGVACQNWGSASMCLGEDTVITAYRCLTANEYCEAHALGATALGGSSRGNGEHSLAHGTGAITDLPGQRSIAGGDFRNIVSSVASAQAQSNEMVLRGRIPGDDVSESVAMLGGEQGSTAIATLPYRGYTFKVTVVASGRQVLEAGDTTRRLQYTVVAHDVGAGLVVDAVNLDYGGGMANCSDMALAFSGGGQSLTITYAGGATKHKTCVECHVKWDEVIFPPVGPNLGDATLWLEADSGVTEVSGNVSVWEDQTSNNHDFSQGTAGSRPAHVASVYGSHSAVRFDGVNDFLSMTSGTLADLIDNDGWTIFAVWTPDPAASFGSESAPDTLPAVITDLASKWGLSQLFYTLCETWEVASGGTKHARGAFEGAARCITAAWSGEYGGAGIGRYIRLEQGAQHCAINQSGNITSLTGGVVIGKNGAGTAFFKGDLFELVIYDRALSDQERQLVHLYLKDKWQ